MDFGTPYHLIAKDVLDGRKVAVFCDNVRQVERAKRGLVGALLDAGVERSD